MYYACPELAPSKRTNHFVSPLVQTGSMAQPDFYLSLIVGNTRLHWAQVKDDDRGHVMQRWDSTHLSAQVRQHCFRVRGGYPPHVYGVEVPVKIVFLTPASDVTSFHRARLARQPALSSRTTSPSRCGSPSSYDQLKKTMAMGATKKSEHGRLLCRFTWPLWFRSRHDCGASRAHTSR